MHTIELTHGKQPEEQMAELMDTEIMHIIQEMVLVPTIARQHTTFNPLQLLLIYLPILPSTATISLLQRAITVTLQQELLLGLDIKTTISTVQTIM